MNYKAELDYIASNWTDLAPGAQDEIITIVLIDRLNNLPAHHFAEVANFVKRREKTIAMGDKPAKTTKTRPS